MKCVDKTELKKYIEGKLDAARLVEIDEHLCACPECRDALSSLPSLRRAGIDLGASLLGFEDCPEYDDISAFADGALPVDQMALIRSHINSCESCFADVERIREMRSHAALREKIEVRPMAGRQYASQGFGLWKRVFAGVAGAAAIAGVAVVIGSFNTAPEKPAMMASKPPIAAKIEPAAPVAVPEPLKPKNSVVAQNQPAVTHNPVKVASNTGKVILRDGSYRVIERNGRLALSGNKETSAKTALEARVAASIEEKLRTGKIAPTKPVQMAMANVRLRGDDDYTPPPTAPKIISPSGKILLSDTPRLTWSKVDMARSYRVRVYDAQFQLVAEETTVKPAIVLSKALHRGEKYTWRVGVRFGENDSWAESAPSGFNVLSAEDYSSIQKVKRALPGSHIALGTTYESLGLYEEAQQEYRALRRANRESSLAKKMLYNCKP
ncbi:MAG: zf-HC2 domain-containing protein [Armatimonadota bacterium]|nr:zf-HC2 domain-containing protein [bacterium]